MSPGWAVRSLGCASASSPTSWAKGRSPASRERVREALTVLEKLGAIVEEVSLPSFEYGLDAYYVIAPAEASSNLARYDGTRYGLRVDGAGRAEDEPRDARGGLRRRGQAPDPPRDVRAVVRLLRRVVRPCAEASHEDRPRLRPSASSASMFSSRRRRRRRPSGSARRSTIRCRCTCPTCARSRRPLAGYVRDLDPMRTGVRGRASGRPAADGAAAHRIDAPPRGFRAGGRIGFDGSKRWPSPRPCDVGD